jgi:hypothetical protein
MYLFNRHLTKPLKSIIKRVDSYAGGDFAVGARSNAQGDAGEIERGLSEIGVSLAINEYETKTVVKSYYRFVPRGVEKIFKRAGITEINSGDVVSSTDNLCVLSVENKEEIQNAKDDGGFMEFVNTCFSKVCESLTDSGGLLLSGDFDLSALPVLFTGELGAEAGVKFALDLTGMTDSWSGRENTQPDFFVMLHNAKFLYGIAGTDEKAFPFLSSSEMNFLSSYSRQLCSLGARVVMTEKFYNALPENTPYSARFIGFVSSRNSRHCYKLYELLDCYTDAEKLLRKRYDERFQKAITMFLKNDFYLARSEFSAILRSNPGDGAARWYIFACEHFFNSSDLSKATYDLFGIDESLVNS